MKVKRLLSAFVAVALLLTTIATMGTVSFAADGETGTITPTITVEIVPDTEGTIAVEDGQYGYYMIAKLSNYGTVTSTGEDYAGRKIDVWQIDAVFDPGVCVKMGPKMKATTDLGTKPEVGTMQGGDGTKWTCGLAATSDNAFPIAEDGAATITEELLIVKVPFVTTKNYFTVELIGEFGIDTYDANGYVGKNTMEIWRNYGTLHALMNMPSELTVGEAPVVVTPVEAMEDFENIADTVKAVYSEANGYKISKSYTKDEAGVQTHTYGEVEFDAGGITNPACIGKAESTENNFVGLDKGDEAYQGIQGDSGFEDATIYGGSNGYDGTHWAKSGAIMVKDADGDKALFINGGVQQGCGSKYGAYTKMVTEGTVEYGFSFKINSWRAIDETKVDGKEAGGFGEVVDSTAWGRRTTSYRDYNKLIRARADQATGYALYDIEKEEWVTILPYDAENEDKNWHDVKYVLDLDAKTYTAYLDDEEKATLKLANTDTLTGADGIDFNTMNYFYNESLLPTSEYYIDDVYAWENPVTVTFTDKAGNVLSSVKAHKGDTVALPEIPGVELSTTTDLTNVQGDMTVVCNAVASAIVYTEDFEGATVAEDGTITSNSATPFASITTDTTTAGYLTLADGKLTIDRNLGNYRTGFNFPSVSTGTVKVSYKMQINQYGKDDSSNGIFRNVGGLTDSNYQKTAVRTSNAEYTNGGYINAIVVYDGNKYVKLDDTKNSNKIFDITYYADLDNGYYTYVIDGVTYGPYEFYENVDEVGAVYFQGNRSGWLGKITIDDVRVETRAIAETAELIGDGGAVVGHAALASATDINPPTAPEVKGKRFVGWYEDANGTTPVTFATFEGDKVYAVYDELHSIYTEDFEGATVAEDGTSVVSASAKPFKAITVKSATVDVYSANGGAKDLTLDTLLAPNSYTMYVGGGGNADADTKAEFTTTSKALLVDDDNVAKAAYSFSFEPVTTGTVKVSYDLMSVEFRRGTKLTDNGGIMGLYDSAANKIAVAVSDTSYNGDNATYGNPGQSFFARDGGTHVGLTSASRGVFKKMEYYADLDNQVYTIVYDGTTYGPFAFAQEVTQLDKVIFGGSQHRGIHVIDNVTVETNVETPVADLIGADGTTIGTVKLSSISDKTPPTAPEVAGKKFMGWYADAAKTIPVTFATFTGDKVYAKYADIVVTADFEDAVVDYADGLITGTGFDIALGKGADLPDETMVYIEEGAGKDGSKALFVDYDTEKKGNVVYNFPEVKDGKIKVSYDFKVTQRGKRDSSPKDMSFGSLISGDATGYTPAFLINESGYAKYSSQKTEDGKEVWAYINQLYTYDTTLADANEVMLGSDDGWQTMTYYADLSAKTYTVEYGDTVYGPFPFTGEVESVNAILFKDNRTGWEGKYYIDNVVVDTAYAGEIPEATVFYTVTFMNGEENLGSVKVKAGEEAIYQGSTPTKAEDENYTYTFLGWVDAEGNKANMVVTADTTVYAAFEATSKQPETPGVTFIWGDINGDGTVDSTDGTAVINSTLGGDSVYGSYTIGLVFASNLIWGDINGDGTVDSTDGTAIINSTLGGDSVYGSYTIGVSATIK